MEKTSEEVVQARDGTQGNRELEDGENHHTEPPEERWQLTCGEETSI